MYNFENLISILLGFVLSIIFGYFFSKDFCVINLNHY